MSGYPLEDCKRCGRGVREDHSHVMVVPAGHKRMYFTPDVSRRSGTSATWPKTRSEVQRRGSSGRSRSHYDPEGPRNPDFPCAALAAFLSAFAALLSAFAARFACKWASELVRPGLAGLTFSSAS